MEHLLRCFQHPDRGADVTLTLYDRGQVMEISMCYNCRHALAIACLQHEGIIEESYEIIDVEDWRLRS